MRSLVLGNGSMLVGYDEHGLVRDIYYDYVGLENHMTDGSVNLLGVYVDGAIHWLNDGWDTTIDYDVETMVGNIVFRNEAIGIVVTSQDVVYNERTIFVKHLTIENLKEEERVVKLFANHQLRMYGTTKQDTVYFDPEDNTIMHYKGRRIAVIGGKSGDASFSEYSVGLSQIEGKVGTWKDAEDGMLTANPIEHGTVDSVVGFSFTMTPKSKNDCYLWIALAKTMHEAKALHQYVIAKHPQHLIDTTKSFWHAWVNKTGFTFSCLPSSIVTQFKKSLLIMRTHVDNNGGILASGDAGMLQYGRDTYGYVWPRDGAYVASAMIQAGYPEVARAFFEFCTAVISDEGYFMHKYRPDRSVGSSWHPFIVDGERQLPIQEDETAQVLISLWDYYKKTKDLEFIERVYNTLIKPAANFMLGFRNEYRLPFPSYDVWEMYYGIHTYTVATIYAALGCASQFAALLGKEKESTFYDSAAKELQEAASKHLWNENRAYFFKSVIPTAKGLTTDQTIDASSFYGAFAYGLFPSKDPRLAKAHETFVTTLTKGEVAGIIRFEGDEYYRQSPESSENPWFITSLWNVEYKIRHITDEDSAKALILDFEWVLAHSQHSGILSEQIDPVHGLQLSASPLAWSHAQFVRCVVLYMEKLEELGIADMCYPLK